MNAQEAEAAYRLVKSQLDSGQVALDEYNRRVSELRYQDNTGTWWAISPTDGSWLKWNGSVWEPAFAHAASVPPQAPAPQPAQQPAAQPSWYIPPAGSQQKPAAAQPVTQPVQPSYYIPPSGSAPTPAAVAYPAMAAATVPAVAEKPKRNWLGIASLGLGILSWLFYPYIMGILAIILGGYSFYTLRKTTGKLALVSLAGTIIALASIIADNYWLVLFPPTQGFTLMYWMIR